MQKPIHSILHYKILNIKNNVETLFLRLEIFDKGIKLKNQF